MFFETLQRRLIERINARVRNGEITERKLAKITGMSQPHVHNLLKGARHLSAESADCMLRNLHMSVADLFEPFELARLSVDPEISHGAPLPDKSRELAGQLATN